MKGAAFSAKAEYACVAALELAARYRDSQPARLKAIADAHGIPHRFLVQILLQMKAGGLVTSTRGSAGGYQLARPPEQITVADVVGLIDRAEVEPHSLKPSVSDQVEAVRAIGRQILDARYRIMKTTTLAELLERARGDASVFQI